MTRSTRITALILAAAATAAALPADAGRIARLDGPDPDDVRIAGFELERRTEVEIEAVGIVDGDDTPFALRLFRIGDDDDDERGMTVRAWLLDADTRETVWRMEPDDGYGMGGHLRGIEDRVRLEPGRYELYLAASHPWARRIQRRDDDRRWWQRMIDGDSGDLEELQKDLARCHVTLSVDGDDGGPYRAFEPDGATADALLRVNRLGDSQLEARGLEVERTLRVGLYGVIEQLRRDREPSDFSWIVDEATRRTVWRSSDSRSRHAGGATKNRVVDDELQLEPGRYVLYVGTDDSHSFEAFNAPPPDDPLNWGMTLRALPGHDASALSFFDPAPAGPALIEFTGAGNETFFEQAFRMQTDGALHVRAIGEHTDRDDRFVDGAWIVDVDSGETVWRMRAGNTMPAGGASKNRMFDGLVELSAGDYVLYWSADDSHAYDVWNSATPFDPAGWGVAVRAARGTRADAVRLLDAETLASARGVLAAIVRVGNDERRRVSFTIAERTRVLVHALGEGTGGSMYDHGSIRDGKGRLVWAMEYDDTEHAGGADKNRMVRRTLTLEPGDYMLEYESDGSHSFVSWNAGPPHDTLAWGITLSRSDR